MRKRHAVERDVAPDDIIRMISLARVAVGAALALMPRRAVRWWLGEPATPGLRHAARSLGARDAALGLGTLIALENDGDVSRWLEAQAMSDATDAFATLASFKHLPKARRWINLVLPIASTVTCLTLAAERDED
ncbi:MAG TPA: hypothetical protein VM573_09190 [Actinomycetota bacterium]|nr:hypothetical protein [Actinomycetota bacterium]